MNARYGLLAALLAGLWLIPDAGAFTGLDRSFLKLPGNKVLTMDPGPMIGVGSPSTQTGRIQSFRVSYKDGYGANAPFESRCDGVLLMDDQKTIELSVEVPPDVRGDDPRMEIRLFQTTAICRLMEAAYAKNWKVSYAGRVTRMANNAPAAAAVYRLEAEARADEGFAALPDYSCPVPSCQVRGEILNFAYDSRDGGFACTAGLKVDGTDGASQRGSLSVSFPKSDGEYRWLGEGDGRAYLHGKFRICMAMVDAAADGHDVTVIGAVGGSRIVPTSLELSGERAND